MPKCRIEVEEELHDRTGSLYPQPKSIFTHFDKVEGEKRADGTFIGNPSLADYDNGATFGENNAS